jgi:hypothetical protein
MFLISEVHPFDDGNGSLARVTMNTELVSCCRPALRLRADHVEVRSERRPHAPCNTAGSGAVLASGDGDYGVGARIGTVVPGVALACDWPHGLLAAQSRLAIAGLCSRQPA